MEKDNSEKEENQPESKRSRRTQSKFSKEVPRYECFCSKQYLSYPALYLHLKNKHQQHFQNSKNGKKIETTKLIETFDTKEGFRVYKISLDNSNAVRDKQDGHLPNAKQFQGQGFPENPLFFQANNFMAYPYQFPYEFLANREESSQLPREAVIETVFGMFVESLGLRESKEKAQTELLLGVVIQCINESWVGLREHGEGLQCRRFSAEHNCKHLGKLLSIFENKWLPEALKNTTAHHYYDFFIRHAAIMRQAKYKKVLQQLLEFVYGEGYEEGSPTGRFHSPLAHPHLDNSSQDEDPAQEHSAIDHSAQDHSERPSAHHQSGRVSAHEQSGRVSAQEQPSKGTEKERPGQ